MNRIALVAVLTLLVVVAPVLAQENRKTVEAQLFDAYYQEQVKRDLDKAGELYAYVFAAGEAWPDLKIRAKLGLTRIAARTGGEAVEEQKAANLLMKELETKIAEKYRAIIQRDFEETRRLVEDYEKSGGVEAQISHFTSILAQGPDSRNGKAAIADLLLFGDRAVPQVATALEANQPRTVSAAARVLVALNTELAAEALTKAFTDQKTMYRVRLVAELSQGTSRHSQLFLKALVDPTPDVRLTAARSLSVALKRDRTLRLVVVPSLENPDSRIRRTLLGTSGYWERTDALRAAHLLLDDPDPEVRKSIAQLIVRMMPDPKQVSPEELAHVPELFRIQNATARDRLVRFAVDAGGDLARIMVVRGLLDNDAGVRKTTVRALSSGKDVPWAPEFFPALVKSILKTVLTEHPRAWNYQFRQCVNTLGRGKRNEENGAHLVGLLKTLAEEAPEDRRQLALAPILDTIAIFPDRTRIQAYEVLIRSEDRLQWFQRVGRQTDKGMKPLVLSALGSRDVQLRAAAVLALSRIAEPDLVSKRLLVLLGDPEASVRRAAFTASLPGMSPEALKKAVLRALADPDFTMKKIAIDHLSRIPGDGWQEALLAAVRSSPERLGIYAVMAVAARGAHEETRRLLTPILEAMKDVSGTTRAVAWRYAGAALTDQMVVDALRDESNPMKLEAARFAGERHLLEAWPLLLELKSKDKRFEKALSTIRDYHVGLKEYLDVKDLKGEDLYAKADAFARSGIEQNMIAACHAYAALGGPRAISRLLDLVRSPNANVRKAALEGLKKQGESE